MFNNLTTNLHLPTPSFDLPQLAAEDWRALAVLAVFPLLLAIESVFARSEHKTSEYRGSYLANLGTLVLNDTLLSLLRVSSLWLFADRFARYGLLAGVDDPAIRASLGFLLLDLLLYGWHRLNHTVDWLWMFHKVHHSDRVMNVTTAFRLHIVEVLLTVLIKALFIVVVGVPAEVVVGSEAIITVFIMFHHTHLRFPGERWLAKLMIVPSLHRVHHSALRSEHDNNFGAVFSIWDRLFGTLREIVPREIGLRWVPQQNVLELVKYGLTREMIPNPKALHAMIAEAAYYRAEKRGFVPGYDFLDWMEAEREIRGY